MRKFLILPVTLIFLAAPAYVPASVDQEAVSRSREARVVPMVRTHNGDAPARSSAEKAAMRNPGAADEILPAKRDGHGATADISVSGAITDSRSTISGSDITSRATISSATITGSGYFARSSTTVTVTGIPHYTVTTDSLTATASIIKWAVKA